MSSKKLPFDPAMPAPALLADGVAVCNIAAYLFVYLPDAAALVPGVHAKCTELALKGTVLLAPEGINLFLAGAQSDIDAFLTWLRSDLRFSALCEKRSYSAAQPFLRMKVKLKKEIVPLGVNNIDPQRLPAPRLSPEVLKQWLDEGRDFVLLDTRNHFEFAQGTFEYAVEMDINTFRAFPDHVRSKLALWKDKTIVTFCTGGIRCEKAAPVMQDMGFADVYQLDGGILKYFERCGAAHYQGDCFVFDQRVGLDGDLQARELI
jgi:UPF0176 protein